MFLQRTLAKPIELAGKGLHSGVSCRLRIEPAEAGAGRVFSCNGKIIPARAEFVVSTARAVVLGKDGARVSTVEHLLAALNAWQIDNARLVVEGPEIPALDGSAALFVEALRAAGAKRQAQPAAVLRLTKPVWVGEGESLLLALPSLTFQITYCGSFPGLACPEQSRGSNLVKCLRVTPAVFAREIAPARTFAAEKEVKGLLAQGFGQGATKKNTVILGEKRPSVPLRFTDEPLRHKILDLVGDLALLGGRLQAHILAVRSGHRLNVELVKKIVERERVESGRENV